MMRLAHVPALVEDAKRSAHALVKKAADKLARSGHEAISDVLLAFPRKAITTYAQEWGADFIMVGSRGQTPLKRFLLGSVAQAVLRTAPCSVEVVRLRLDDSSASHQAMKILLCTDGSACSTAAVKSVANRPWPFGSQIKIISVAEPIVPANHITAYVLSSMYPASILESDLKDVHRRAEEAVAGAREILNAAGLNVCDGETTSVGDPRVVLLDDAKKWGTDLIVLGSHGWRGVDRLLMGSVSESIALHADCSVEIIQA